MNQPRKPRHIRDIAHIYLSRVQSSRTASHDRLIVCGETGDFIPAFHVANIAALFAQKGSGAAARVKVTLTEVSGLLPNAGFYFALPPQCYLAHDGEQRPPVSPALPGVELALSFGAMKPAATARAGARLELIHLPPADRQYDFTHALARIDPAPGTNSVFLFMQVSGEAVSGVRQAVCSVLGTIPFHTLNLRKREYGFDPEALGTLTRWERSVADRIPVVVRDPRSTLARRYDSICEALIYKIRTSRRKRHVTGTAQRSARLDAV